MGLLDRNALLTKEDLKVERVDLPSGNHVFVRQMTAYERDLFEQSLLKKNRDKKGTVIGYEQAIENYKSKLAVVTICDEAGALLLEPGDYLKLSQSVGAKTMELIISKAQELNGITEEDKEDIIKNSEVAQGDNSSSGSVES